MRYRREGRVTVCNQRAATELGPLSKLGRPTPTKKRETNKKEAARCLFSHHRPTWMISTMSMSPVLPLAFGQLYNPRNNHLI